MCAREKNTLYSLLGALALVATLFVPKASARDGTWPLRFANGNDGTWPVKYTGDSAQISPAAGSSSLVTKLIIDEIAVDALPGADHDEFACQNEGASVQKHRAEGTITVSGIDYQIIGACFDPASDKVEIVAHITGQQKRSFLSGKLPEEASRRFAARLKLEGDDNAGRYRFDGTWPVRERL